MTFKEIENYFISKKISSFTPGFYDEESFLNLEKTNINVLEDYACYVLKRPLKQDYVRKVKKIVPIVSHLLHDQLVIDGRKGACIDISLGLNKMLEKLGIWNFIVKGSLTIEYPNTSNLQPTYYWAIEPSKNIDAAHAWVIAPPYSIIDLSIKQQNYRRNEVKYLPDYTLSESVESTKADLIDLVNPVLIAQSKRFGWSDEKMLNKCLPRFNEFLQKIQPLKTKFSYTKLKYIPYAIGLGDSSLEDITSLKLNGKTALEIYSSIILPEIK